MHENMLAINAEKQQYAPLESGRRGDSLNICCRPGYAKRGCPLCLKTPEMTAAAIYCTSIKCISPQAYHRTLRKSRENAPNKSILTRLKCKSLRATLTPVVCT